MKFIHTADIHIGRKPSYRSEDEVMKAFSDVINECNEWGADILLVAGDMFDSPPSTGQLREVNYMFGKLNRTKVVIIAGNHDYLCDNSCFSQYKWNDNVTLLTGDMEGGTLDSVRFDDINTRVWGLSYSGEYDSDVWRERLYDRITVGENSGINILLGHGGDANNIPVDIEKLSGNGFDYLAFGHIHKPMLCERGAYCGSLVPLDRKHTGARGYIKGIITKENASFDLVPLNTWTFNNETIVVDGETTREELLDRIKALQRDDVYTNVRVMGRRSRDTCFYVDNIALPDKDDCVCGQVVDIVDESVVDYDYEKLYEENEDNILGHFIKEIWMSDVDEVTKIAALETGVDVLLDAREEFD